MKPFNLQDALAGKPFGRMKDGKFIKATDIHVLPDWMKFRYPLFVLFENGTRKSYTKDTYELCMQPEETVWYCNVYDDCFGIVCRLINELQDRPNRIAILKTTIIGKEVKTEVIPC